MRSRSTADRTLPFWALIATDTAAAVVLLVVGAAEMDAAGDGIFFRAFDGFALALVAAQTLPAAFRRLWPIGAVAACVIAQATALWSDYAPTNAVLAIPFGLYAVACQHSRRVTVFVTLCSLSIFVPTAFTEIPGATQLLLLSCVIFGAASLAGDGSKARRLYAEAIEERARQDIHRREAQLREVVVEERAQIARELHDAVGHTVNVLVVHAGAGRLAAGTNPERAAAALAEIESIGRYALADIDRLLGLLREDQAADRRPTQGLHDIPALVERMRTTGLDIRLEMADEMPDLPMASSAAAYRIVQEALTNVIKHAGPATVVVRVAVGQEVSLTVEDDGRGAASQRNPDRIGRGLIGMRERAVLLGGHLQAGPRAGGGYRVHARFPLDHRPELTGPDRPLSRNTP